MNYSDDWQSDTAKIKEYLRDRIMILYELLDILDGTKARFCGLSITANLRSSSRDDIVLKLLAERFLKSYPGKQLHDIELKQTMVEKGKFYSNITVKNYRVWKVADLSRGTVRLNRADAVERGAQVVADYNDRFAYNEKAGYSSDKGMVPQVIEGCFAGIDRVIKEVSRQQ